MFLLSIIKNILSVVLRTTNNAFSYRILNSGLLNHSYDLEWLNFCLKKHYSFLYSQAGTAGANKKYKIIRKKRQPERLPLWKSVLLQLGKYLTIFNCPNLMYIRALFINDGLSAISNNDFSPNRTNKSLNISLFLILQHRQWAKPTWYMLSY